MSPLHRFAAVLALSFLLTGSTALGQSGLVTLRLASSPVDDVAPVLYAQRAGLFRKAGLDVDLQRANSGAAVTAAVAGGAVDIGKSSLMSLIGAHAHGIKLHIVAAAGIYLTSVPGDGSLVVAANSPIRAARDLNGKVVSSPALSDLNNISTRAWMDANGGDSQSVQFVELPIPAVVAALQQGRIAAGALTRPYSIEAVASGQARLLGNVNDAIALRFLESAWFASDAFIENNRSTIVRFARVVHEAAGYTNAHPAEMNGALAAFTGVDTATIARMVHGTAGTGLDPNEVQPVINTAAKYKVISQTFDARELLFGEAAR
jgi:NitT/TauT family transport system substrate-binding protein